MNPSTAQVQMVLGPVGAAELGRTLMHEHAMLVRNPARVLTGQASAPARPE
jgi:predicted metal-dependent phosphotriesterase family hydrolase